MVFSLASKVGDTAREVAVRNGFKKIAKLLAPSKSEGDTIKVSASLTLKKSLRYYISKFLCQKNFCVREALFSGNGCRK